MKTPRYLVTVAAALAIVAGITVPAGASAHRGVKSDVVYFRPVLCFSPSHNRAAPDPGPLSASSCSPTSLLNESNLGVTPKSTTPGGYTVRNVDPDPALAGVPSTSARGDTASATVLLPAASSGVLSGVARFVLGPAEMSSTSVDNARATRLRTGTWVVDFAVAKQDAVLWDEVAEHSFHEILGVEFQGKVVSVPIMQPSQSSFTSLNGLGEISGNLTKAEALALAHALDPG